MFGSIESSPPEDPLGEKPRNVEVTAIMKINMQ
jgi:hypothetical protein